MKYILYLKKKQKHTIQTIQNIFKIMRTGAGADAENS